MLSPEFKLIPILCLQVMLYYVHWHCSIDYYVELSFWQDFLAKNNNNNNMAVIS